jgi:hypothetical protein
MARIPPWLLACLACASTASAQVVDPVELADGPDPDCVEEVHRSLHPPRADAALAEPPPELPAGRAIAALDRDACLALLEAHGVGFRTIDDAEAAGVPIPIRLEGPVGGVEVSARGHAPLHEILDCRLAVALLAWAPRLRAAGVRAVRHYSIYRPGARVAGSGRVSGHAKGLALDLAILEREDGEPVDVLHGWEVRERGREPCDETIDEGEASALLRGVVCAAIARELFQVVLTPHHDRAHANHVHLELVPGVDWSYVR